MENSGFVINLVAFLGVIASVVFIFIIADYFRFTRGTRIGELIAIWGVAGIGSIAGSVIIGIVGVILAIIVYPNTDEWGAALVGAVFGSFLSVPSGMAVGGAAGTIVVYLLLRLNGGHPALVAGVGAFLIGTLVSGAILVPVGFIFFAVGHI
jgi:hypothetical protein